MNFNLKQIEIRNSRQMKYPEYETHKMRVSTYKEFWPTSETVSPYTLARAGFFSNGGNETTCYFCGINIKSWKLDCDPFVIHALFSPHCRFLTSVKCSDFVFNCLCEKGVPRSTAVKIMEVRNKAQLIEILKELPTLEVQQPRTLKDLRSIIVRNDPERKIFCQGALIQSTPAKYEMYASLQSRLESFISWPIVINHLKKDLIEAGFFYTGVSDSTVCYQCGCCIRGWLMTSDPWVEHALKSQKCRHILQRKGTTFVNEVVERKASSEAKKSIDTDTEEHIDSSKSSSILSAISSNPKPIQMRPRITDNTNLTKQSIDCDCKRLERWLGRDMGRTENCCASCGSDTVISEPESAPCDDARPRAGDSRPSCCHICAVEELSTAFLPCGHLVSCGTCAVRLTNCPLCRKEVTTTVRIYLS